MRVIVLLGVLEGDAVLEGVLDTVPDFVRVTDGVTVLLAVLERVGDLLGVPRIVPVLERVIVLEGL